MHNLNDICKIEVSDDAISLSNETITVTYDTRLGTIALHHHEKKVKIFDRSYILVHTDTQVFDSRKMIYKSFSALDFKDEGLKGKSVILRVQDMDGTAEMNIRLSVIERTMGYMCRIQFKNKAAELRMKAIDTLVLDVDDSSRIITGWDGSKLRLFHNGFHSWELSQAKQIKQGENLSHFYSVLNNIQSHDALVIGYTTFDNQLSEVSAFGRKEEEKRLAQIVATCKLDAIPLTEKDTILSEEMQVLVSEDALTSLSLYMDIVSNRMEALTWEKVPTGWCTWYFYYTQVDEIEVMENTEFLAKRYPEKIEWIQIDDGFQKSVGDWEENQRFSSGLEGLVEKIKIEGFRPGIWLAPFVAAEHSEVFKDKPDWFIRNLDNIPIIADQNPLWLGNYYALDLSNPHVINHIKDMFAKFKEYGFEYFKIDFLHYATMEGIRYDMKMTRAQAFKQGMDAIREAVGNDMILGCGAPIGPCVGKVNMMRIGTDIATSWRYDWGAGVYECSINTMTRAVMHDRLWINDPDCVLVRQDDNELTLDEIRLWLSVVALSGGAVLLSDRMTEVSDERLALLDKILPSYRKSALALDSLEIEEPRIFALPIETEHSSWAVVAVVNLSENPIDVSVSMEDLGFQDDDRFHVFEFWTEKYHGESEPIINITGLKPHSCKLLVLRPVVEEPCLLSTSIHFTQGAIEVTDTDWNAGGSELSLTVNTNTRNPESLFFVFSKKWTPLAGYVDEKKIEFDEIAPEVIALKQQFKKGQTIRIKFSH